MSDQVEQAPVQKPVLQQAPVKALDPDGLFVVSIGTGAFAVGTLVCGILYPMLAELGQLWRLWVAVVGLGLGLLALAVIGLRKWRRKRDPS